MNRPQQVYYCASCDAQSLKWTGQCLECGAWGTMTLARIEPNRTAAAGSAKATAPELSVLQDMPSGSADRRACGIGEVDRVFGGGIVAGSVTLLGGEPGIGKSTLALMLSASLAERTGNKVVYVSGEESGSQVRMRADRLHLDSHRILFLAETGVSAIVAALDKERPAFAVIDSVQTIYAEDIPSEAGAVNQVRGATAQLVSYAKRSGTPLLLIGHVTKDGHVAGPKTLEHLVDTVLSFEGERSHPLRVLRSLKNRFGSTDETGIFEMNDSGLKEIKNPSAYLLDERRGGISGSVISCVIEGTRPILVEIQALVQRTAFGYPTRRASGFDQSRLEMLIAVLGRRGGIDLSQHDVYVNVVGGLRIKEPAADLAVIAALASACRDVPLPDDLAVWGEVGLGGEVRSVIGAERRISEAAGLGIKSIMTAVPRSSKPRGGASVTDVRTVADAVALAASHRQKAARTAA
jgi:DNA repair protein RadA/Sms